MSNERQERLVRSGSAPLWAQLKAALLDMILREGLQRGDRLPSETALCARFGVSRSVVREAMNQLVIEHLVYKIQGKGSFVAGRRQEHNFIGSTIGFSGELSERRQPVTRRVLRQEVCPPIERERQFLRLDIHAQVVAVDRVLSVNGVPRILVRSRTPFKLAPGLESAPLHSRSLYETLSRRYGITFARAERWLDAVCASSEEATLLEVAPGAALLGIESIAFDDAGTPVEYYRALFRTDRSRLHLAIDRPAGR